MRGSDTKASSLNQQLPTQQLQRILQKVDHLQQENQQLRQQLQEKSQQTRSIEELPGAKLQPEPDVRGKAASKASDFTLEWRKGRTAPAGMA